MKTQITSISELKNIALEILLSKTNKLSKISPNSIFNAVAFAISKIGQKALKEIALIESQLFPDYATGVHLDLVAKRYGINSRLGATKSSGYIYLYGKRGTFYDKDKVQFISNDGISFVLEDNVTIDEKLYAFAHITSTIVGSHSNAAPLSITNCENSPVGHDYCNNTFATYGGRDKESDDELRDRIVNLTNSVSNKTLEYLAQIALNFNSNILKFVNLGTYQGKTQIGVYTQSGAALTQSELNNLGFALREYLCLSDISENLEQRVIFVNIDYTPIDLSFKIDYMQDLFTINQIYNSIQMKLIDFIDYRYLDIEKSILWIDLYNLIKNTEGIVNVNFGSFLINGGQNDIIINKKLLPKFRQMIIYDINGNILLDNEAKKYMPFIYPVYKDINYTTLIK